MVTKLYFRARSIKRKLLSSLQNLIVILYLTIGVTLNRFAKIHGII